MLTTLIASGVAAVGLVSMFWVGTYVHDNLKGLRDARAARSAAAAAAAAPPPPPKSLTQLILERRAELNAELDVLRAAGRAATPQQKRRRAEIEAELWHYRVDRPWYKLW